FLSDGNVPIDNSASERSIRPFTLGRKNWLFSNTIRGAQASAVVYSIVESAKANNLRPYYYLDYILEKLPEIVDEDGNTKCDELEKLLPWADEIPARCRKEGR
ncbi:IS66 C-terminal element, partial [[Clostridium] aminophilum]